MTTTDFAKFGYRERDLAKDLLTASCEKGFPNDFEVDEVTIMMNQNSGNVFFTNSEFQVAMMNGDDLESFYSCPICGHDGFMDEIEHNEDEEECQEWIKDMKENA